MHKISALYHVMLLSLYCYTEWNRFSPIQIMACGLFCAKSLLELMVTYHHFDHQGKSLHWRHNDHDCVSNHQHHHCLLTRLFRRRLKKTSNLRVIGLCVGNSPETGEFPAQMASIAEKFHFMTSSCYQRVVICIISAFCSGHIFLLSAISVFMKLM